VSGGGWMGALADHVGRMREAYPDDELVLVFDIDGTIVDTRHLVVDVLLSYDRHHGTDHFHGIAADDVVHHETEVDGILGGFHLPAAVERDVRTWYLDHVRDPHAVAAAHRPYQGVLSVIRWFQLQPRTRVALNTGRPESMRELTLAALNALGRLHRVAFRSELLFMAPSPGEDGVADAKVDGLRRLAADGYRVVAVVDNEPAMIAAMAGSEGTGEILFLHADTIFASRREPTPRTVSGSTYGLAEVVDESELGRRVTFVWHGVNDRDNLDQFLASEVRWAELDVRRDPLGRVVLRHDSFVVSPWSPGEELLLLDAALQILRRAGRAVKLDLKEGVDLFDGMLELVRVAGFADEALWFNGSIETIGRTGFRRLRAAYPDAVVQCPIDFLVPLLIAAPALADDVLAMLAGWGVDRVSLDWETPGGREVIDVVEALGWEVNLYGVPHLEAFLEAALMLPTSLTADFNFPEWNYFGRGPSRAPAAARSRG
jgi:beta-phosphoglucomutase-like phosphatase (HAD superfamily)